jgi:hypothetical protein
MAVDTESRRIVSKAIQSYQASEIDNFQLDDILSECRTSDELVNAIIESLWYFYDDCTRSTFRNAPAAEAISRWLRRWEQLLITSMDFGEAARKDVILMRPRRPGFLGKVNDIFYGKRPGFATNPFWPLASAAEWESLGIAYESPAPADHFP